MTNLRKMMEEVVETQAMLPLFILPNMAILSLHKGPCALYPRQRAVYMSSKPSP